MCTPVQVLVVDDDRIILDIVRCFLDDFACEIYCAECVEEAFQLLVNHRFDLVLTDLQLGKGSGIEVLRRARNMASKPVLFMMTGSRDMAHVMAGYEAGADRVVLKPLSMMTVLDSFLACGVSLEVDENG